MPRKPSSSVCIVKNTVAIILYAWARCLVRHSIAQDRRHARGCIEGSSQRSTGYRLPYRRMPPEESVRHRRNQPLRHSAFGHLIVLLVAVPGD